MSEVLVFVVLPAIVGAGFGLLWYLHREWARANDEADRIWASTTEKAPDCEHRWALIGVPNGGRQGAYRECLDCHLRQDV